MKTLYLGLELPPNLENVVHHPFIKIVPRAFSDPTIQSAFANFKAYTHLIFTSKSAVSIFFDLCHLFRILLPEINQKIILVVGQRTAEKLKERKVTVTWIAKEETAEGIIKELNPHDLTGFHFFLPQSALSRPTLVNWFKKHDVLYTACPIYDTLPNIPKSLPDLNLFNEIIFTSPSVVNAFIQAYGCLPKNKTLTAIGPVTERYLEPV